ncbi:hypothetical protein GF406_07340 [candidate division KSB1 bacterium]|nr:hypothetical protein [candidate division KSB1 bacterium]
MKKRVYIETTIPSFYFETRTEPDMVARKNWTREWWDNRSSDFECVTSITVNWKKALILIKIKRWNSSMNYRYYP